MPDNEVNLTKILEGSTAPLAALQNVTIPPPKYPIQQPNCLGDIGILGGGVYKPQLSHPCSKPWYEGSGISSGSLRLMHSLLSPSSLINKRFRNLS